MRPTVPAWLRRFPLWFWFIAGVVGVCAFVAGTVGAMGPRDTAPAAGSEISPSVAARPAVPLVQVTPPAIRPAAEEPTAAAPSPTTSPGHQKRQHQKTHPVRSAPVSPTGGPTSAPPSPAGGSTASAPGSSPSSTPSGLLGPLGELLGIG